MSDNFQLDPDSYAHLRSLAARILGPGQHTIQPTGLLHEAWAKLAGGAHDYVDRVHFMRSAAQAMRHILVDRARARQSQKRGGGAVRTTMAGIGHDPRAGVDVVELDQALSALERVNPDAARIVLMRVFGGLTVVEVAEVLEISDTSVKRQWRFARAWLLKHMGEDGAGAVE